MTRRKMLIGVFAFLALFVGFSPVFAQVKEPSSGVEFPSQVSVGGTNATITGTGLRKKFTFKVYAIASYIDPSKIDKSKDLYLQLLSDGPAKQITMHFVRDLSTSQIRDAFRESLEKNIPNYEKSPAKSDAEAFLNLMTDVKANEELVLRWTQGGKLELSIKGQQKGSFQNPVLARGVWAIWLGASPISSDIKNGLVANLKK
jgi:predicted DNA-binding protein YlxM (UPF0122 family)